MLSRRGLAVFRVLVIAANLILAALAFANLYTLTSGAIRVYIPEEKDIRLRFDEGGVSLVTNFTVVNRGFYDIYGVVIDGELRDSSSEVLMRYHREGIRIPAGSVKTYDVVIPVNLDLPDALQLLLQDTTFYLDVFIEAKYMWGLSRFVVDERLTYSWESLKEKLVEWLMNLTVGDMLRLASDVRTVKEVLPKVWENVEGLNFDFSFTLNTTSGVPFIGKLVLYYREVVILEINFTCSKEGRWGFEVVKGVV